MGWGSRLTLSKERGLRVVSNELPHDCISLAIGLCMFFLCFFFVISLEKNER